MLAAISETVWQALIAACVTVALAWVTKSTARTTASTLLDSDVKQNRQLDSLEKTAISTHRLVNAAMGRQLQLYAIATARLAKMTGSPEDVLAAEIAGVASKDHLAKQADIDEKDRAIADSQAAAQNVDVKKL